MNMQLVLRICFGMLLVVLVLYLFTTYSTVGNTSIAHRGVLAFFAQKQNVNFFLQAHKIKSVLYNI